MSHGNGELFAVDISNAVLGVLKQLQKKYSLEGHGEQFLAALQALYDRLRKDPHGLGEALYTLPALKLVVHVGIVRPLAVQFAIHQHRPLVLIKWVKDISS